MLRNVFALFFIVAAAQAPASGQLPRAVHLRTTDNVFIGGTYYPVHQTPAPAVVLVHSVDRDRNVWGSFPALLQRNGLATLAIDLRGYGESTRKQTADGPVTLDVRTFTAGDFQNMMLDVETAVDWLHAQPEINGKRIALIGESFGANIILRYAAINEDLAAIVVLSPGITYRGVRTDDIIAQISHKPLRLYVSQYDPFAFESCKRLVEIQKEAGLATATNELTFCTGNLHGSDMLLGVRNLPQLIVNWLKDTLTHPPSAPPPAAPAVPPASSPVPAK
ncbi:MAG TPA: alpha/beta fold hydrolase [Verrucomicrobiae bacterium]|nr:alpha/beta fold hydrolase [Verrucomicrobiae bacterium]